MPTDSFACLLAGVQFWSLLTSISAASWAWIRIFIELCLSCSLRNVGAAYWAMFERCFSCSLEGSNIFDQELLHSPQTEVLRSTLVDILVFRVQEIQKPASLPYKYHITVLSTIHSNLSLNNEWFKFACAMNNFTGFDYFRYCEFYQEHSFCR